MYYIDSYFSSSFQRLILIVSGKRGIYTVLFKCVIVSGVSAFTFSFLA